MVRGFRTRHSSSPHVLEHFSFYAAIHSQTGSRCEFPVSSFQFLFFHHSIIPIFQHSNIPTFHPLGIGYKNLDCSRDDEAGIPTKSQSSPKVPLRRAWKKAHIRDHPRFIRG
jgi:hypothetical protein